MKEDMWKIREIYNQRFTKGLKSISIINILIIYRYISFLITLVLYYTTAPQKNIGMKIGIMIGLVIAYTSMAYLYLKNQDDKKSTLMLSIVETVENSIFIIISGGFSSPFIWYFISTAFITAVNVSYLLAIAYSTTYFITAACSSIFILQSTNDFEVVRLYINIAISCIIIIFVVLQLIRYVSKVEENSKKLSIMNHELEVAKANVEKTLRYSIEVYETINIFHSHKNDNILLELIKHFSSITGIQQVVFIRLTPKGAYGNYITYGLSTDETQNIYLKTIELIESDIKHPEQIHSDFDDGILTINYVMYEGNPCGAFVTLTEKKCIVHHIGTEKQSKEDIIIRNNNIISLFMKIVSIVLKKLEFKEVEEQLLISEEQNRIANEIHDIVLQRLFAISCKLYVMSTSEDSTNINENLIEVKESIDMTMKELREAIYSLSWEKQGLDTFKCKLIDYAEEIQTLHGVEISLQFNGDTQKIKVNQKRGLYRVICEAMNNAIRHGKAKHVDVRINIDSDMLKIQITDDGVGFDYHKIYQKHEKGLGLNNINRIIEMMNGQIKIKTGHAQGTKILMEIPYQPAA